MFKKSGFSGFEREQKVDKIAQFFDISPGAFKNKQDYVKSVSNIPQYLLLKSSHQPVPNTRSGEYVLIGFNTALKDNFKEKQIDKPQREIGERIKMQEFKNSFVAETHPLIYQDEEGNIWQQC